MEVTVAGLGFNTPDSLVQEYITKFGGKLVTNDVIYGKFVSGTFQGKLNGVRKYRVDFTQSNTPMGTFHILDGNKVKVFFRGNHTCGWCQADITRCPGGAKAKACKEKGTKQVHLGDHMRALWSLIQFDPQTFEMPEYNDLESSDNIGGDRKVLETVHFPKQVDRPSTSESEKNKYNVVRVRNFPLNLSDDQIVSFLQENVDKEISVNDIISEKTNYSTNISLGPGPSLEVISKAADILDYKIASKTFFEDRKLYVQLHRPLTPEKKERKEEEEIQELVSNKVVESDEVRTESDENKIKEKVSKLNKITETPKLPVQKCRTSQYSFSSARKPSLDRHKGVL